MGNLSAVVVRRGYAARWRVGLLALAAIGACAAASAKNSSGANDPQAFVDAHNAVRAAVRMPAGYPGPWTPIPPVEWSDEIAVTSQAWADNLRETKKCGLMHSDTNYGENLAGGKDMDAAHAVKMWASEGEHYIYKPRYEWDIPTGHYTQVVWRKTTLIGCGYASCGKKVVIVCRYNPPGNHIDKAPF
jgi:pathogenesis-related protein 1